MKYRRLLAAAYAVALFAAVPSAAYAAKAYEGSDYSEDVWWMGDSHFHMYACDMESDSRHVYAEYQINSGEWSSVTDGDGANNGCGNRGPYVDIIQHRVCEAIDFYPDNCGSYVYP